MWLRLLPSAIFRVVGTDFGLTVYDGTTTVSYTDEDGLGDNRINHINEDSNGWIWVGEKDGVSVFDGEAWTTFTTADGLPFGGINHVTFDSNGDKWLASSILEWFILMIQLSQHLLHDLWLN